MDLWICAALLFCAGFLEDLIETWATFAVVKGKTIQAGLSSWIYVILVYSVFRIVLENLDNFYIIAVYGLGSALGSMALVWWYKRKGEIKK